MCKGQWLGKETVGWGRCRSSLISLARVPAEMGLWVTSSEEEDCDLNRKGRKKRW